MTQPEPSYPRGYLYRRIVLAKTYIDAHYAESLNLDDIADEARFSKYHFIRLFCMAYGKTPHQYLQGVRIERAKHMLQADGPSVTEVCYAVGFSSLGSFSTLFKKYMGQSPAEYRAHWKSRRSEIEEKPLAYVPGCFVRAHAAAVESQF